MASFLFFIVAVVIAVCLHNVKALSLDDSLKTTHDNNIRYLRYVDTRQSISAFNVTHRKEIADRNLNAARSNSHHEWHDDRPTTRKYIPGTPASDFSVPTLDGILNYPGPIVNHSTPVVFFSHDPASAFSLALWSLRDSVSDLVLNSPKNAHYIFLTRSEDATVAAHWFRKRICDVGEYLIETKKITESQFRQFLGQVHFAKIPTQSLTNWIPDLLLQWQCMDHNCGIDQLQINDSTGRQVTLPRLDARYDWIPSPQLSFGNKTLAAVPILNPCVPGCHANGSVVITVDNSNTCSYAQMVENMQKCGAVAVVVVQMNPAFPQDMNCKGSQCGMPLHIPATNVPFDASLFQNTANLTVKFINKASSNLFAAIDHHGKLAEVGWFLYPTMHFLAWQTQWFGYQSNMELRLAKPALEVPVFNRTPMEGNKGATVNVTLPGLKEMAGYGSMELDLSLSCEDNMDADCPHWDRTLHVNVCCNDSSPLCGAELGRWISPFRRRIGRWLTDVTALLPLFTTSQCTFTMKGALAGEVWVPSLTLRFTGRRGPGALVPSRVNLLYGGSFTFNSNYNTNFKPYKFNVPGNIVQVTIVSVITGHGSDENGCGEFCVTSHHFTVNNRTYNRTFNNAGTPLGCAEQVPRGVEPNEHGTWLYGRDGWCDGQEVDPWVITLGSEVKETNLLTYNGWFQGKDPNPKHNPGMMALYSYLVFYERL